MIKKLFPTHQKIPLCTQLFNEKPHCRTMKNKAVVTKGAAGDRSLVY